MKPDTFISYSRQCMGFVDDLAHQLERRGIKVWLDYRALVPGRPWAEQIHQGLEQAELMLLVVSSESIRSGAVELEWRHFLERGKRVILLIFQAVQLPDELASLEWVDFRGNHPAAMQDLLNRMQAEPCPVEVPAPCCGFKVPPLVWLAFAVSLITAVFSLFAFWAFLIPLVLVPLPWQILKREYDLPRIQTALWTLPVALFFSFGLAAEIGIIRMDWEFDTLHPLSLHNFIILMLGLWVFIVPLLSASLILLLRSSTLQRWGKPEANLAKFANPYNPQIPNPQPVHFHVEHAPEDARVARELTAELVKVGHVPQDSPGGAGVVLVLLSRYKMETHADPEQQVVIPILLQKMKVPENLSKLQWIDFRRGVRNLDAIAQLLPQPARMLQALGVRPTGSGQTAMPGIIVTLVDYLIIMAVADFGSFLSYRLELGYYNLDLIMQSEPGRALWLISMETVVMLLVLGLIYLMVHAISVRRGWLASAGGFLLGMFGLLALFTWQSLLGMSLDELFLTHDIPSEPIFSGMPFLFLIVGGFIAGVASLIKYKDLRRWFPARVPKKMKLRVEAVPVEE